MNIPELFKRLSAGVSLLILASGFSSLGYISCVNTNPEDAPAGFFAEASYSIIGGYMSIFVGLTFLAAAILFFGTPRCGMSQFASEWRKGDANKMNRRGREAKSQ
jgi:hypothetical protein